MRLLSAACCLYDLRSLAVSADLPGNASRFYETEPCEGITDVACKAHVLGGGSALWQADPSQVTSRAWPNAAVVAEVLWSAKGGSWTEAERRLRQFRCALGERGVAAGPVGAAQPFGSCGN